MSIQRKDAEQIIIALYNFFLLREPDPSGLDTYSNFISNNDCISNDYFKMLKTFSSSEEFISKRDTFIIEHLNPEHAELRHRNELLTLLKYSKSPSNKQKNLLISGFFRSGTTAVTTLLNFSPEAFVSQEAFDYTDINVWEKKYYTKDHVYACLQYAQNIGSGVGKINSFYKNELKEDVDYIKNPRFMYRFFENVDFSDKRLHSYCTKKTQYLLRHYELLNLVGDKSPLVNWKDIVLGLLINPNLHILFMIRNPKEISFSAKLMEKCDPEFPRFNYETLSATIKSMYTFIGELQKYCPHRITLVQYEGFFESREKIENFFYSLGLNPLSVYEPGIEFIIRQAKEVSTSRMNRYSTLNSNEIIYFDESFIDELQNSINWKEVI